MLTPATPGRVGVWGGSSRCRQLVGRAQPFELSVKSPIDSVRKAMYEASIPNDAGDIGNPRRPTTGPTTSHNQQRDQQSLQTTVIGGVIGHVIGHLVGRDPWRDQ